MKCNKIIFVTMLIVLLACNVSAGKKHKKSKKSSGRKHANKSKANTKWSTSTELGPNGGQLTTEEHGYYVKRTFLPFNSSANTQITAPKSPPYLGIPIAWFPCEGEACTKANTAVGSTTALVDGFLCDDDCTGPYEPICGRIPSELVVFYNKCKLNVAKCRTHGLWLDVPFMECNKTYANEIANAERKFKSLPFFRNTKNSVNVKKPSDDSSEEDAVLNVALLTLNEIGNQIAEAEAEAINEADLTSVKGEVSAPHSAQPVQEQSVSISKPETEGVKIVENPMKVTEPTTKPVKPTTDALKVAESYTNQSVVSNKLNSSAPDSTQPVQEQSVNKSASGAGQFIIAEAQLKVTEPVTKPMHEVAENNVSKLVASRSLKFAGSVVAAQAARGGRRLLVQK